MSAFVESFTWTALRYPGRVAALAQATDAAFRDDLIRFMRRRLAIAQALPLTIDYLASLRARGQDTGTLLARIAALRRFWDDDPDATRILDLFLVAAGVPVIGDTP